MTKNFLIVDDYPAMRAGVCAILEEHEFYCAGQAGTLQAAEAIIHTPTADLLILDVQLPDGDGIQALKTWRNQGFKLPTLVKSMMPEETASRALKAGANGYFNKSGEVEEFLRAVQAVARNERYISAEYAALVAQTMADGKPLRAHEQLSEREFQVLCEYAKGRSPAQIAEKLGIQVNTLSAYRARILKKLGLTKTTEMVQYALKHRLIAY